MVGVDNHSKQPGATTMNRKLKIALAGGIGAIGIIGLVGTSFAQPSINNPIAVFQQKVNNATDLGDGDGEKNDDEQEQQQSAKLQSLAKITPQQAKQAAEAKQGGTATSVQLEKENGSVVYAVVIGKTEVTVDANNGRVLATETN